MSPDTAGAVVAWPSEPLSGTRAVILQLGRYSQELLISASGGRRFPVGQFTSATVAKVAGQAVAEHYGTRLVVEGP